MLIAQILPFDNVGLSFEDAVMQVYVCDGMSEPDLISVVLFGMVLKRLVWYNNDNHFVYPYRDPQHYRGA